MDQWTIRVAGTHRRAARGGAQGAPARAAPPLPTARRAPAPQTLPAALGARALDGNASITARLCNLAVRWGETERAHEEFS